MDKSIAYIALGSNVGDGWATLRRAMELLGEREGIAIRRVSQFIETDPVGGPAGQDNFVNGAAEIETTLGPQELLSVLHEIEKKLGRNRTIEQRWGSRTCDLDLLLMDDIIMETDGLTIPHPRMHLRKFVLTPLSQIAPKTIHPILKKTISSLLSELETGR